MQKLFIGIALTTVMIFQGCQTTSKHICKICHPEEAAQAEAAAGPIENPIKRADTWIQKHMW